MKLLSEKQIKQLEDLGAVPHFNSVLDSNYKRGTSSELNTAVADIYDEATGTKISRNFGCKICCMNLFRQTGTLYRNSVAYYKQKKADKMKKAREAKQNKKPDVEMKDAIITINLDNYEQ